MIKTLGTWPKGADLCPNKKFWRSCLESGWELRGMLKSSRIGACERGVGVCSYSPKGVNREGKVFRSRMPLVNWTQ